MFDRKRIRLAIGLGMLAFVLTIGGGIFIATVFPATTLPPRAPKVSPPSANAQTNESK